MPPLGLTDTSLPLPQPAAAKALGLHLEDALASGRRLWFRGRFSSSWTSAGGAARDHAWWSRWWSRSEATPPPPTVHLESRIGGEVFEADATLEPGGYFEASLPADLARARRGWRMTRNRITFQGQTVEKCGVALMPPAEARSAVVVLLPLDYSWDAGGAERLARREAGGPLAAALHQLQQRPHGPCPVYYVGCVPPEAGSRATELALAATTLGWPHGNFVLLPADRSPAPTAFAHALDRLRWLFADTLELLVINREPGLAAALPGLLAPHEDRAPVCRSVNADDDPAGLTEGPVRESPCARNLRPSRSGRVTRYPIVFCHGMLAFSTIRMVVPENLNCFALLRDFFHGRGVRALYPQVLATGGVAERAVQLKEQILRWTSEPVNVIAHSMGGLDARHLITHLGMADRVRSLTTVATPHHGTYVADWFVANFRQRVPLLGALEALGTNVDGFRDCQLDACRAFNARTPDMPGVRYFSYGGEVPSTRVSPALRRGWSLLTPVEGPNDGLVSAASARWGECLGTVHADHFAQTPDAVFVRPGEDFDALGFYTKLVEDLARRGF